MGYLPTGRRGDASWAPRDGIRAGQSISRCARLLRRQKRGLNRAGCHLPVPPEPALSAAGLANTFHRGASRKNLQEQRGRARGSRRETACEPPVPPAADAREEASGREGHPPPSALDGRSPVL